ncbi:hypothetical protein PTTG_27064 [Puccinia triticina 1-1 BBBD Race 1]|uniref:Extracellular membrane protein CFEM domain-containing protein n=1 Tax=Puccinia triticina (isolate 1-1 / race 1 (BBBD)) TaxID=630390 RepID=A0A180GQG6_PUCT1|nr:hypothetical protein PTTG_27064 [Puccinia triticina 1-1 BBBD Race 1]
MRVFTLALPFFAAVCDLTIAQTRQVKCGPFHPKCFCVRVYGNQLTGPSLILSDTPCAQLRGHLFHACKKPAHPSDEGFGALCCDVDLDVSNNPEFVDQHCKMVPSQIQ